MVDAVGAVGEGVPVDQHEADDLAEGEGDDGEVVAAQPQHREAEDHAPAGGEDAGERQADPERPAEMLGKQGVGIGADRVEGDVAEIEQAGEADDDVEAPAEHHIGEDQRAEVEDVAGLLRADDDGEDRDGDGGEQEEAGRDEADLGDGADGLRHAGAEAAEERALGLPDEQVEQQAADEDDGDDDGDRGPVLLEAEVAAGADGHGLQADGRRGEGEGDDRGEQRSP